jgi:hypothetical protein
MAGEIAANLRTRSHGKFKANLRGADNECRNQ